MLSFLRRVLLPRAPRSAPRGNLYWLLLGRALRSAAQTLLAIAVPLYLAAAGHSSLTVGAILSAGALGSLGLVLIVGVLAGPVGRRPILLALALGAAAGAGVFALTTQPMVLAVMAAVASVGRGGGAGSGGGWGPFYPAEQPLVAASVEDADRNAAFASLSFVGVIGNAAGSLLSLLAPLLQVSLRLPPLKAFQVVFWLAVAGHLGVAAVTWPIREAPAARRAWTAAFTPSARALIGRLWVTNSLNGLVIGVLGPFLTYWFTVRYGARGGEIGALYTLVNGLTALAFLAAPAVAGRFGSVRAVVASRLAGGVFLAALGVAPTFFWASVAYTARAILNAISMTLRQSFVMGVSDDASRPLVAALSNLPSQLTATAAPTFGAYLLEAAAVEVPVWVAAGATAVNALLYGLFFRSYVPPEERRERAAARAG